MNSTPFSVNTAVLRRRPGNRIDVECVGELEELTTSGASASGHPVDFNGTLEAIEGDRVVAVGTVKATWDGECRRCLQKAGGAIESKVREIFEAHPTEGETYGLAVDSVNLEPMVRETVMLELPVAPVCREDCAGVCAECGQDLNAGSCDCRKDPGDPRWSALDALKDQN